jgi:thiol-disulfide isomerase/thioredoxin
MQFLEIIKRRLGFILTFIMCLSIAALAQETDKAKLQIGDKAPELRYSKWIKGRPTKLDEPGRFYVVEFWATWCGPCIASMPHLSEFAKKHQKEATVIGVDIWEAKGGDTSKRYESFLPKVKKFVKGMGDKMSYEVAMDNNDQFMGNQWMRAAGQDGIPCSFMIRDGIILWIGHPINLDSIYTVLNSGNYDVAKARKEANDRRAMQSASNEPFRKTMAAYSDAVKQKEFDKAIRIVDSASTLLPELAGTLGFFKAQTLIENFSEDVAMAFIRKWQSGKPGYTGSISVIIAQKPRLSKDTYLYAIGLLKNMAEAKNSIPSLMYKHMATAYYNMGDYKEAVDKQQKAVEMARRALKEGKYAGFVMEDTVVEYEKTLNDYKKKLK